MKGIIAAMFCSTIAVTAAGCASSGAIRQGANEHLAKAQRLEAEGDFYRASKERAAADRQYAKANQRAYEEASRDWYWY